MARVHRTRVQYARAQYTREHLIHGEDQDRCVAVRSMWAHVAGHSRSIPTHSLRFQQVQDEAMERRRSHAGTTTDGDQL